MDKSSKTELPIYRYLWETEGEKEICLTFCPPPEAEAEMVGRRSVFPKEVIE